MNKFLNGYEAPETDAINTGPPAMDIGEEGHAILKSKTEIFPEKIILPIDLVLNKVESNAFVQLNQNGEILSPYKIYAGDVLAKQALSSIDILYSGNGVAIIDNDEQKLDNECEFKISSDTKLIYKKPFAVSANNIDIKTMLINDEIVWFPPGASVKRVLFPYGGITEGSDFSQLFFSVKPDGDGKTVISLVSASKFATGDMAENSPTHEEEMSLWQAIQNGFAKTIVTCAQATQIYKSAKYEKTANGMAILFIPCEQEIGGK